MKEFPLFEMFLPEENNMQIITEERDGKTIFKCRGRFQLAEAKNKNNRVYPKHIMEREISKLQPIVDKGQLIGELDHPRDRVNTSLSEGAIKITYLEMNGNEVTGEYEPLNTPKGKIVQAYLEDGIIPGISSRGSGRLVKKGAHYTVTEDFRMRTWDLVSDPSTEGCFPALVEGQVIDADEINQLLEEDNDTINEDLKEQVNTLLEFGQIEVAYKLLNDDITEEKDWKEIDEAVEKEEKVDEILDRIEEDLDAMEEEIKKSPEVSMKDVHKFLAGSNNKIGKQRD